MKEFEIYNNGKSEGMRYAYDYIKQYGLDAFYEELKFRSKTNVPLRIARKAYEEAVEKELDRSRKCILDTVLIVAVTCLRDEFDFGKKRVARFIDRYNLKTACLMDPDISGLTFKDLQQYLKEELNLDMTINGEI